MTISDLARWRSDIDALAFAPQGHQSLCMVHRLAFRTLLQSSPTPEQCLAYFAVHQGAFQAAARAKIARRGLEASTNFHLTSRDVADALKN